MLNTHRESENRRKCFFHNDSREYCCSHQIPGILRGRTRQIGGEKWFTTEGDSGSGTAFIQYSRVTYVLEQLRKDAGAAAEIAKRFSKSDSAQL